MVIGDSFGLVEAVRELAGDVEALREVVELLGERVKVLEGQGGKVGQGHDCKDHLGGADVDHNVVGDSGVSRDGGGAAVGAGRKGGLGAV